jgi:hypothetical protein
VCRLKHVEQLRNIGIINSTTRLRLVGSFYEICITMHGSMDIKFTDWGTLLISTSRVHDVRLSLTGCNFKCRFNQEIPTAENCIVSHYALSTQPIFLAIGLFEVF